MSVIGQVVFVFTGDTKQVRGEIEKAQLLLKDLQKETEKTDEALRRMAQQVDMAAQGFSTFAGLLANIRLAGFVKEIAMTAAQYQVLGTALTVVGRNMGYTTTELVAAEATMRKVNIAGIEARQSLTQWIQMGMKATDAVKLARAAQDLAAGTLRSSSEAYSDLTTAIMVQYPLLLRQYGIVKYLDQIYAEYSVKIGKSISQFTEYDRRMAFFNTIMEEAQKRQGAYLATMEDSAKLMASISSRIIPDLKAALGEGLQPILLTLTKQFYDFGSSVMTMSSTLKVAFTSITTGIAGAVAVLTALAGMKWVATMLGVVFSKFLLIGGAVAAAIAGIVALTNAFKDNTRELIKNSAEQYSAKQRLVELVGIARDTSKSYQEQQDALKKLHSLYPEMVRKTAAGYELVNQIADQRIAKMREETKVMFDELRKKKAALDEEVEAYKKWLEKVRLIIEMKSGVTAARGWEGILAKLLPERILTKGLANLEKQYDFLQKKSADVGEAIEKELGYDVVNTLKKLYKTELAPTMERFRKYAPFIDPEAKKRLNEFYQDLMKDQQEINALTSTDAATLEKRNILLEKYLSKTREYINALRREVELGMQQEKAWTKAFREIEIAAGEFRAKMLEKYDPIQAFLERIEVYKRALATIPKDYKEPERRREVQKYTQMIAQEQEKINQLKTTEAKLDIELLTAAEKRQGGYSTIANLTAKIRGNQAEILRLQKEAEKYQGEPRKKIALEIEKLTEETVKDQKELNERLIESDYISKQIFSTQNAINTGFKEWNNLTLQEELALYRIQMLQARIAAITDPEEIKKLQLELAQAQLAYTEMLESHADRRVGIIRNLYEQIGIYNQDYINRQMQEFERLLDNYETLYGRLEDRAERSAAKRAALEKEAAEKAYHAWVKAHSYIGEATDRAWNHVVDTFKNVLVDRMTGQMKSFKEYWHSFWNGVTNFVMDLLTEMVKDYIKKMIAMQMATSETLGSVGGGGGGGGGWGWLGSLVSLVGGVLGLQHGAIVTKPRLAMIAEKEPEAVIPLPLLSKGAFQPQLPSMLTPQERQDVYVFQIQAVDTDSFVRLLSSPDAQRMIALSVKSKIDRNTFLRGTIKSGA